ncbi:MAG: hypothetical protein JO212_21515, partial [Acetobacteraceae bacterium]|nr:hypothetical protein [Acetobacteraceae bacterium]
MLKRRPGYAPKRSFEPEGAGMSGWQFWIDRGGTFTDVVALKP